MSKTHVFSRIGALVRSLRWLDGVYGWRTIAYFATKGLPTYKFDVKNGDFLFRGNTESFIDREIYLFGHYEGQLLRLFLSRIPLNRRATILDVGANVGTHALRFASAFKDVYSFEPNPSLWPHFEENMRINNLTNVHLCKFGLGISREASDFFMIDKKNYGLGTFNQTEQYDMPLKKVGTFRVECGDEWLFASRISTLDALKIDTQGFEWEVLSGLKKSLEKHRPYVWFEISEATKSKFSSYLEISDAFPYSIDLYRFDYFRGGLKKEATLKLLDRGSNIEPADYLAIPKY